MEFESDIYLENYFGMARDILLHGPKVTVIFYAVLNDDVSFKFSKTYESDEAARRSLDLYQKNTTKLKAGLPYNSESVVRINSAIESFLADILQDEVFLPDENFIFLGDKTYIQTLLKQTDNAFLWYD